MYSECASEDDEADNDQPDEDIHLKAVLLSYIADHHCSVCVSHIDTSSKLYGDLFEHASVDEIIESASMKCPVMHSAVLAIVQGSEAEIDGDKTNRPCSLS